MPKPAYYNEIEPFAAQWLRNLIAAGHIAPGVVDDRSIKDVQPSDLSGFTQCHFFAGIGVWSYALRSAGWGDERLAWTGSCPCQSFSSAGKRRGFDDERHLWPEWHRLVRECRPGVIFGEQVQSKDSLPWLDLVSADLEAAGYAFGALGACAAGVGAPHKRSRLYFVAEPERHAGEQGRSTSERRESDGATAAWAPSEPGRPGMLRVVADTHQGGCEGGEVRLCERGPREGVLQPVRSGGLRCVGDACGEGLARPSRQSGDDGRELAPAERAGGAVLGMDDRGRPSKTNGFWRDADWVFCRDGKWRAVRPGSQPLADGIAGRVGLLRAYGNAIVAPLATEFVKAYMSCRP